ncbi:MAG: glycosyltransferase family 39 protein [Rhodocyclaceae bacterium]|nr:glycosyltransferase family 39 protein [Rhodocyclaceae bacterium]
MPRRAWLLAALFAFTLAWFGTLDYRKLVKSDEGRYAEIPREMVASGDWLTPRLNGIKYFEKPPLQYWATATAFELFGQHDWTARLWPALTGFLGILLAWFAGRRLFGAEAGLLAAVTLASSLLYLGIGHFNSLDMGLTFFLEAAVFGFLLAQSGERRWMLAAWAALALAVLTKGIVALVLTGGTLLLHSLLTRDLSPWRRLEFARGLPLFLLIAAPWFIAVSLANPEFAHFFFIHEHFERFLTKVHHRYQPAWYFVPILILGALPWTTLALQSLAQAWRQREKSGFAARRFLVLWCVVVFGFFSVSDSKLPSYILPLFPALALLLGDWLNRIGRKALIGHLTIVVLMALPCLFLAPYVADQASAETPLEMMGAYARWLTAAAAIWLAGGLAALAFAWRDRGQAAILTLAAASFVAGTVAMLGHENLSRSNSTYWLAASIEPLLPADVPFYSFGMYDQTLPYYLRRTLTLVQHQDEMAFGLRQEPRKWVPSADEFKRRWSDDADAFAVMDNADFDRLRQEGLAMSLVARDTRRVIVRKPR